MPTSEELTGRTIDERFEEFHDEHPEVYETLVDLCRRWREWSDKDRWSMRAAFHVLRWEVLKQDKGDMGFKINDHFTPLYARKIMSENPELEGMFEVRKRRSG